jgi:hypothetical protein
MTRECARYASAESRNAFLQLFDSFPTAATGNSRSVSTGGGKSSAITCAHNAPHWRAAVTMFAYIQSETSIQVPVAEEIATNA